MIININAILAGECEDQKGSCMLANNCTYIWEDTPDCVAFQKVCCLNDYDYVDE